jgi:hypothetical protein
MKVFTMVKDEEDIVEDWVRYHGEIFGYNNLYIIDNFSLDGTYTKLMTLKQKYNINVTRLLDYSQKGNYMTQMMQQICNKEIVFPIDIDEFIVYYDKKDNKISCDKNIIINYIKSLPPFFPIFKMNYILSKITNENGYNRAVCESTHGEYLDYGSMAKTFFNSRTFKGKIDHGNHYNCNNYILTKLCLIHFHERNVEQMKKKIYNNLKGLGYNPFNLNELKQLSNNTSLSGYHHIANQIRVLENTFSLSNSSINSSDIVLSPFNNFIINL